MNSQKLLINHISECLETNDSGRASWVNLKVNTIDYAIVSFLRGLNVRHPSQALVKKISLNYIGIECDDKAERKAADRFFCLKRSNSPDLNYLSVQECVRLKDRILEKGLSGFTSSMPTT